MAAKKKTSKTTQSRSPRKSTKTAAKPRAAKNTATTKARKAAKPVTAPQKRARDPRLPAPGTVLTREYKGKTIRATVMEGGFRCGGKHYGSLSGIARELTGTSVNGYLWFKLTGRTAPKAKTPTT